MEISYPGKASAVSLLKEIQPASFSPPLDVRLLGKMNFLIKGENLASLQALNRGGLAGKIKLIYIDPPYATGSTFKISAGRANTVSSSKLDPIAYADNLKGVEFLEFIRSRLILLRELLADDGSIYLHIDYKIGHYVKVIMDEVFGRQFFRNDITRIKCNPKNFHRKAYGNIKDMILFYSKGPNPTWNDAVVPLSTEEGSRLFKKSAPNGRKYTTIPLHAPGETDGPTGKEWKGMRPPKGRHWRTDPAVLSRWEMEGLIEWSKNGVPRKKIFLDEKVGKKLQDIWSFKDPAHPVYPTEKNIDLIKTIIMASSNPGDIVLDCFAGSGTTLLAAEQLNRGWIGIDESKQAFDVITSRLSKDAEFALSERSILSLKQK